MGEAYENIGTYVIDLYLTMFLIKHSEFKYDSFQCDLIWN